MSQIKSLCPNAVVLAYGLNVGSSNPSYDVRADLFNFNGTTYDFEPLTTCYVDAATGNDVTKGGTSATDPKKTIQACIDIVGVGATIIVAAGTYPESVVVDKDGLTIQGAGHTATILDNTISAGTGEGITISAGRSNITIADLRVTHFQDGINMPTGPLNNVLIEDVDVLANTRHGIYSQAFGLTGLTVRRVEASSNGTPGPSGRGIWLINGEKRGIVIENSIFNNNNLVGIDVSDGNVAGLSITGNTVTGNGDAGIGVFGAQGPDANQIRGNTVTNNGRFGIEIKNPTGNGATSGFGSLVVENNTVSRTVAATDARDYAGILVVRRGPVPSINPDQPSGVVITDNTVSGYHRKASGSTGDGFGIVVEGQNQTVRNNTVANNDVGIQFQAGNVANTQSTGFFDRGDAATGSGTVLSNTIINNGVGVRGVGIATNTVNFNVILNNSTGVTSAGVGISARNNWWGCNTGPNTQGCDSTAGIVDSTPWLTLRITRTPAAASASPGATFNIVGDLIVNSNGTDTSGTGTVQNGTPISFGVAPAGSGTITPTSGGTVAGLVNAVFTAGASGCPVISATSDDQTVTTQLCITPAPTPSPTPTPSPSPSPIPSPSFVPITSPSPSPATLYTVTVSQSGTGTVSPGTGQYVAGTKAKFTATPGAGQVFAGWMLDGTYVGYATTLDFTVNGARTLVAQFVARSSFNDVSPSDPDYQAIIQLAALGIINPQGVNGSGDFQPDREVNRAEVAAFVARTFDWEREFHSNNFPDRCDPYSPQNCIDDRLWNDVAALADYGVVGGYTDTATCAAGQTTAPCYLPRDQVKRVQVLSIIARSFIKAPDLRPTGFWERLAADSSQYTNVGTTGTQRSDLTTYRANAGPIPSQSSNATFPDPDGSSTRRFIIQALYQAFNAEFGADNVP